MFDFSLYGDIYLRKISDKKSTEPIQSLFSFAQSVFEARKTETVTIFKDKTFSEQGFGLAFNQSYCVLYVESLSISQATDDAFRFEIVHLPRLRDHSRAIRIIIDLRFDKVVQSKICTERGTDSDIWYFLIQLADFSLMAKFKHMSGIPV